MLYASTLQWYCNIICNCFATHGAKVQVGSDSEMSEIKPDEVQRLANCLAEMPDAESPLTKRKTVALLASSIQQARDKGYTLKQIARQLQNNGFDIGYTALRNELSHHKKARSGPKKPRAAAKEDPRTHVVTPLSGATPRDVAPAKASPRAADSAVPPVVFPPGAACVFTSDGCFIPAPDPEVL